MTNILHWIDGMVFFAGIVAPIGTVPVATVVAWVSWSRTRKSAEARILRHTLLFTGLCVVTTGIIFWLLSQGLRLMWPPAHPFDRAWIVWVTGLSFALFALLCSIIGEGKYRVALFLSSFFSLFFWVVLTPVSSN